MFMWIFHSHQLERIERLLEHEVMLLKQIRDRLDSGKIDHFNIIQTGDSVMPTQQPVIGIVAGATGTFSAIPADAQDNQVALPAGIVPTWTSSDTTNAPVVASADGLSVTITVPADAPVGTEFTLSVQATLEDGTVPTGSTTVPFLASAPSVVAKFVIVQNS